MQQFTQDDIFSTLTKLGEVLTRLLPARIITERVVASCLVPVNTHQISWPRNLLFAFLEMALFSYLQRAFCCTGQHPSPCSYLQLFNDSQTTAFHNKVLLLFSQACTSNGIWGSRLCSAKQASRRCPVEMALLLIAASVNGTAPRLSLPLYTLLCLPTKVSTSHC